jgi:hypothetical protein
LSGLKWYSRIGADMKRIDKSREYSSDLLTFTDDLSAYSEGWQESGFRSPMAETPDMLRRRPVSLAAVGEAGIRFLAMFP